MESERSRPPSEPGEVWEWTYDPGKSSGTPKKVPLTPRTPRPPADRDPGTPSRDTER